jgi:prepilin-type N-terminal cleavage/methylation domain-containing protein
MSHRRALRGVRRQLARRRTERGFSLIELIVAMAILAIVASGFAVSVAIGLRGVAFARQQQVASDLATARLEHLRSVPYAQVALSSQPIHSTDPTNADNGVSSDNTSFDVTGQGSYEPLVVDTNNGAVLHFEDPVQVGSTLMEIYQYVTWVNDPTIPGTQDYKRVTVVVQFHTPTQTGVSRTVRASSLFGTGDVVVVGTSTTIGGTTTTVGATTTTAAATTTTTSGATTTTTAGPCPGDHSAPTGTDTLNGSAGAQAGFTAAASITVTMNLTDTCTPILARFSNDGVTWSTWITYDPLNPTVAWALGSGDGTKTVSFQTKDNAGNQTQFSNASITLDTTLPSTPTFLNRTVTCSGANRTVNLSWGISNDTNFTGYRVYRSTDGVTWSSLLTTTSTAASDTHKKSLDSVRYYVVGYDAAGNESAATSMVSLVKNQCS